MSNFWDSIIFPMKVETVPVKSSFWAGMGLSVSPKPKPVKQSKPKKATAKKSKAVVKSERVYETVNDLIVPAEDCTHHWVMAANAKWVVGTCKLCSGERWFKTQFDVSFNDTFAPGRVESLQQVFEAEQAEAGKE